MSHRLSAVAASALLLGAAFLGAEESTLTNFTGRNLEDEIVRLKTPAPGPAGTFIVQAAGKEVPYVVEDLDGRKCIWIRSDFAAGEKKTFALSPGKPAAIEPKVKVVKEGETYLLDNGLLAVKVPASAGAGIPGPVSSLKLGDKWVGRSFWKASRALKNFTATVIGDGTVVGKVRLRYDFEGQAGAEQNIPAFAEVNVLLGPGWKHVEIAERHEMSRGEYWEFEASAGWSPTEGIGKPFSGGFGQAAPPAARALKPIEHASFREDMYLNLFPRWNQGCRDGWFFAAHDGTQAVGALVVRPSRWVWPHNNSIEIIVKPEGNYAGFRGGTWKGQRLWWLLAGPQATVKLDDGYIRRYSLESLDKLNHEVILEWPGKERPVGGPWSFGGINPTDGGIRGGGTRAVAEAGKAGDYGTLVTCQLMMHPDVYGSYWNFWSPENPNFFTDFVKVPIGLASHLQAHPRYPEIAKMALLKFKEDLYHSVTMPGGAGQECPGYEHHALTSWVKVIEMAKAYFAKDQPEECRFIEERVAAAEHFLRRISQPAGEQRLYLHMGDTHPSGYWRIVKTEEEENILREEAKAFKTEELPGYGVIFNNKPATADETYLAFKSGPNRGHYHGDQLAFHYCAHAAAVAVDHHCSYGPRAGQEHMHNRLAFSADKFPYANMDGYERLIALKTSPGVDIAMGQVESDRLRWVKELPSETWHQEFPQLRFAKPLCYRRTVVFMKNGPQDYFVFRDQFWAPQVLNATYCLHVVSDKMEQKGQTVEFGNATLFCAQPAAFTFASLPWSHRNGPPESTQGARLTIQAEKGQFITVLYPGQAPTLSALQNGVKVGADEITFAGDQPTAGDAATYVTVRRGGQEVLTLAGKDVNLDRFQGEVGLFVPDMGYPFGEIPDWLVKQRGKRPDWAK